VKDISKLLVFFSSTILIIYEDFKIVAWLHLVFFSVLTVRNITHEHLRIWQERKATTVVSIFLCKKRAFEAV